MAGAQTIAVWTLLLLACGSLFYWAVVLYRVVITVIQLPTGRDGVVLADGDHRESATRSTAVVVPAHNEQGVIGELIASLRSQDHPDFIVVLALDRCTDDTARVAREAIDGDERFEIVEIGACPPGWAGKVHAVYDALQRSMRAADAELLVFVDADCTFAPTCLRAAAALLADRGLHLLSLLNTLTSDRWFEWFVQPMAGFELMRQYPLTRVNRAGPRQRAFANGQFLMFDAEA
ncbi:MAG: hypothetical protein CMJ31_05660, partial [Phycisphaerae bacterium]|nr:hypothetical protein [Phycisphaerae bacterium]